MCGIAGFFGEGSLQDLQSMMRAIRHRGPDANGYFQDDDLPVFFGHQRLSILDHSGGAQPMSSQDGRFCIVFNGEIYNHLELRRQLQNLGRIFISDHSDTEVLLQGFAEWGKHLLSKLNGMFVFVIFDKATKKIFFARDRCGEKPLYYFINRNGIIFCSELKGLLKHPLINSTICQKGLSKFLGYGFFPGEETIIKDVKRLKPGHYLEFDIQSMNEKLERYWAFRLLPEKERINISYEEAKENLVYLLKKSVSDRLIADVPVGIFLSGGVDSTVIVSAARMVHPKDFIKTFCIGFNEPSYDESKYAKFVSDHFSTNHKSRILSEKIALSRVEKVLTDLDEPLGDASLIPMQYLCDFAKNDVTVCLSGDGGDELFSGYDPFKAIEYGRYTKAIFPKALLKLLCRMIDYFPKSDKNMSFHFKANRFSKGIFRDPALWLPIWMGPMDSESISNFLGLPMSDEELYSDALDVWFDSNSSSLQDKATEYFGSIYLPGSILTKSDRASMSVSLEVRSPFLDNELLNFALSCPENWKLHNGSGKRIIKDAFSDIIPRKILKRSKKGFGIPTAAWTRRYTNENFKSKSFTNPSLLEKWLREHKEMKDDHRLLLWTTLAYKTWDDSLKN